MGGPPSTCTSSQPRPCYAIDLRQVAWTLTCSNIYLIVAGGEAISTTNREPGNRRGAALSEAMAQSHVLVRDVELKLLKLSVKHSFDRLCRRPAERQNMHKGGARLPKHPSRFLALCPLRFSFPLRESFNVTPRCVQVSSRHRDLPEVCRPRLLDDAVKMIAGPAESSGATCQMNKGGSPIERDAKKHTNLHASAMRK
jgi:hypothetical protein